MSDGGHFSLAFVRPRLKGISKMAGQSTGWQQLLNELFLFVFLQKATLVSAVDVYEEEESELLISFNRRSL